MKRHIPFLKNRPSVNVIRLSGVIAAGNRGMLNDAKLAPLIERAFKKGKPDAVALVINSPGGSPVQSSLIAARILRLSEKHKVDVYTFVEDVAASGGYWLACAAKEIWVDENSVLGSIGVISAGFGFDEFITRHGIDRRVHTAGKSKSMLDPFRPENPEDVSRLNRMLEQIHKNFKTYVSERRGAHLSDNDDLFTGEVWVGDQAVEQGLADGVGHLVPKMQDVFGDKVSFRFFGPKRGIMARFGAEIMSNTISEIEERAEYARFGL